MENNKKAHKMKTHYATVERGNESNPSDEWSDPICGIQPENPEVSNEWLYVNCKKCLKARVEFEQQMKEDMQHSCNDMAEYVKFNP